MGISLYTSRVILAALGVEDYGIYNVVGGIVSLFAFINGAMSLTTQRYIAYELGQGKENQVRRVFSTCVMIHGLIAVLIFILAESIGWYLLEAHLTIPPERMRAACWVYQFSILNCIIMTLSTPYNGAIVAYEKMQAFAYISLLEAVLRLMVAFIITYRFSDKLIVYAFLLSLTQLLVRMCYTLYCKLQIPAIRFSRNFDRSKFKQILGFSGWALFNNASIIACGQGINILLNMFFNPAVNAARGIAVQVEIAVSSFSRNFQMAINPQITKNYALNDWAQFHSLVMTSSKYAYFLMLLLSLPILLETNYVLGFWLTSVPAYSVEFIRIILIISLVNTLSESLNAGVSATGKIKYFQTVSGLLFIGVLPVSFYLFKIWPYPLLVFGVYFTVSIVVYLYKLFYSVRNIELSFPTYCKKVLIRIAFVTLVVSLIATRLKPLLAVHSFADFVGSVIAYASLTLMTIFLLGLTKQEKHKVACQLKKVIYWVNSEKN